MTRLERLFRRDTLKLHPLDVLTVPVHPGTVLVVRAKDEDLCVLGGYPHFFSPLLLREV